MRVINSIIIIAFLTALASCNPKGSSAAQDVYVAEASYAAALRIELAYDKLPHCGVSEAVKLCSNLDVIRSVQRADDRAWAALQAAERAVLTSGFGDSAAVTTVASAQALTTAFVNIAVTLKTK